MSFLLMHLIKLSVGLGVVYLFYQVFLRRLTFYNWNRWYLLGYSVVVFVIPFIDISSILQQKQLTNYEVVKVIPIMENYAMNYVSNPTDHIAFTGWDWIIIFVIGGAVCMLVRLLVQFHSYYRIKNTSAILLDHPVKVYQVKKNIIPFSFGNSIFVNPIQHSREEFKEIIRHEFVHVKEKHTIDIIWSEILCALNWYNPFAWLLREAIRQNLEFIADNNVLQNGIDRKQYQYLLLKVNGISAFGIGNNFNFSSLKKRIAMMNKMRSAKLHLVKFLFLFPLAAVMLIAFRGKFYSPSNKININADTIPVAAPAIAAPRPPAAPEIPAIDITAPSFSIKASNALPQDQDCWNNKGFCITIADNRGESVVIVKNKDKKIVESVTLVDWNKNQKYYEEKYGEILPPPPPPPPLPPSPPAAPKLPKDVSSIHIVNNEATVTLKNGQTEKYDLDNKEDKATYEKKYGKPGARPKPPKARLPRHGALAPSTTIIDASLTPVIVEAKPSVSIVPPTKSVVPSTTVDVKPVIAIDAKPVIIATVPTDVATEKVILEISKTTTRQDLDQLVLDLKSRGFKLHIKNANYNNGILTSIEGTISNENNTSVFSAKDFSKIVVVLFQTKKGKSGFYVHVTDGSA